MKKNTPHSQQKKKTVSKSSAQKDGGRWIVLLPLLLTLVAYLPAFKAGFVNWDDGDYVTSNLLIRHLSNIKELLTASVQGNYHPLTMLSLAFNYAISGLNPWSYHAFNILLHLANVFLVYQLASRLSRGNKIISFTTALLFGVHPMHVESVAWVSERKDVLYGFFFLLALLSYLRYVDKGSRAAYISSLLWLVLSLTSKPAAIIFPAVLLVIDFYRKRSLTLKLFIEKIPFVLLAATLAYLTLYAQKTVGATDITNAFTALDRFFFGFYGYMMYFLKMIFPVNLSAFYAFPPINEPLPITYILSPFFLIASVILCLLTRKKYREVTFGFAFYFVNLLLILQFFIVGSAIIANRYTYVPYFGLFFLAGWLVERYFRQKTSTAYVLIMIVGIVLTASSYQQAATWKNGITLWNNAINNAPGSRAYTNRATLLRAEGKLDLALADYNEALVFSKEDKEIYCNRGNVYFDKNQDSLALIDYNHSLSLKPDHAPALDSRGVLFARQEKYDLAMADLNKTLESRPDYKISYKNRGRVYFIVGQYQKSIDDYEKYLTYDPDNAEVYNDIGVDYQAMKKYEESLEPFSRAINLTQEPVFYLNRSYSQKALGKTDEAIKDALHAREGGVNLTPEYEKMLGI